MANNENLVSLATRPQQERIEIARKGQEASTKAKKEKKMIKDSIELLLGLPIKNTKMKQQLKELGISEEEMNNQTAMVIAIYQKAIKGDVSAFNTLRDTIGQKPVEKVETTEVPKIVDDV